MGNVNFILLTNNFIMEEGKHIVKNMPMINNHWEDKNKITCRYNPVYKILSLLACIILSACFPAFNQEAVHTMILFSDISQDNRTTQVFDFNTGKIQAIVADKSLLPVGWSPSGKWILFDGLGITQSGQVWICRSDGRDLHKVFDVKNFPEIEKLVVYTPEHNRSLQSFWLSDTLLLLNNLDAKYFLIDISSQKILQVNSNQVALVSPAGEFWVEQGFGSKNSKVIFLSGNNFSIPHNAYRLSPDGKKVVYMDREGDQNRIYLSDIDPDRGFVNQKKLIVLSKDYSLPTWSPNNENLLFIRNNPNEKQPPMDGWCSAFSVIKGQMIYQERCDFGGTYISWLPDPLMNQIGMYSYDDSFHTVDISNQNVSVIAGLNQSGLPPTTTRWIADTGLVPVP